MESEITKVSILANLFWKLMERIGTQGVQFVVQIVLARLLLPRDYGVLALIIVFVSIANVFIFSSFNTALIQKKDANETDFSSVFYLSLLMAALLYTVLFIIAPFVSAFYDQPLLTPVLRVLAITLFMGVFNSIQNAVIARRMVFKKLFYSSFFATILSGAVGISMAYLNFGVWALVASQMMNQLGITLILWFTVKWRPSLLFSFERVKGLFSFGWKLLLSSLLNTLYINMFSLIIGKIYNPSMLGFFDRGRQFPDLIVSNIDGAIQAVMFPVFASQQDKRDNVKEMVRRTIITSSFVIFPMMIGLAAIAKPMVLVLLTEKWLPSVPFIQIYCLIYLFWPVSTSNLQAINAMGRSDIFLKLEIIKKCLGLAILCVTISFGIYAIAFGGVITGFISIFINAYPTKKILSYNFLDLWKDIMPSLLISLGMGVIVYSIQWLTINTVLILIIQIVVGVVSYIAMAYIFKLECLSYLLNAIREILKKTK